MQNPKTIKKIAHKAIGNVLITQLEFKTLGITVKNKPKIIEKVPV